MNVYFESYKGHIMELFVALDDKMEDVKVKVYERLGVLPEEQIFFYVVDGVKGERLEDVEYADECFNEDDHIYVDRVLLDFDPSIQGMG